MSESGLKLVSRCDWNALEPSFIPSITSPVRSVVFGFPQERYAPKGKPRLGSRPSYSQSLSEIQFIQKMDMKKYPDIKYK